MSRRLNRLAPLVVAAIVCGCPTDPTPERPAAGGASAEREAIDLLALFDVADVDGSVERTSLDGSAVRQRTGGALAYAVALPERASLRGTARRVDAGASDAAVRVAVTPGAAIADTATEPLGPFANEIANLSISPGEGRETALDVDLAAFGGRMARIEIRVDATDDAALDWIELGIGGVRDVPTVRAAIPRERWNVVLVLFDSLRADHIEPYGAKDGRTPNFARLAREGVTFADARASASWTRPSVAAMLTSFEPEVTGVLGFRDSLPDGAPYLPQLLHEAGYRTLAVVNNGMVSRTFGFARGFDAMAEIYRPGEIGTRRIDPEARASVVWAAFVRPFAEAATGQPIFVYIHAIEPHSPYDAPEPYGSIDDFGYAGNVETDRDGMRKMRFEPEAFDREDLREVHRRYRAEVAYVDAYLGRLVQLIEKADLADSTLLVVVSDHGDEFREHGGIGHGVTVYREMLHVPWIMRLPGVLPAGVRVAARANLVDLPATILDLVGVERPPSLRGESLVPWIAEPAAHRVAASYGRAFGGVESVAVGRWKLIRQMDEEPPGIALFDLAADPDETRDLAPDQPIAVAALLQLLRQGHREAGRTPGHTREIPQGEPRREIDAATLEHLRALGYAE